MPIEYVRETGSTNVDLLTRVGMGESIIEGTWLVADRQTRGRGRHGRDWLDGTGNFMGSTIVRLSPHDPPPPTLSFVTALAVYETIVFCFAEPRRLRLKWPNDIMLDGAKFCGILLEREGVYAVAGVGVNLAAAPSVPGRPVESLARHGPAPARDAFAEALAARFAQELAQWRQYGPEFVLERWLAAAHEPGSALRIHDGGGSAVSGTFEGLEDDGALRLRLADGSTRVIHAGDVELGAR